MLMEIPLRLVKIAYTALRQLAEVCFGSSVSCRHPLWLNKSIKYTKETSVFAKKLALNGISDHIHLLDTDGNYLTYDLLMNKIGVNKCNKDFTRFIKLIAKLPHSRDDEENNRISQTPRNQQTYDELKTTFLETFNGTLAIYQFVQRQVSIKFTDKQCVRWEMS